MRLNPYSRAKYLRKVRYHHQIDEILKKVGVSADVWNSLMELYATQRMEVKIDEEQYNEVLEHLYLLRVLDEHLDDFWMDY